MSCLSSLLERRGRQREGWRLKPGPRSGYRDKGKREILVTIILWEKESACIDSWEKESACIDSQVTSSYLEKKNEQFHDNHECRKNRVWLTCVSDFYSKIIQLNIIITCLNTMGYS